MTESPSPIGAFPDRQIRRVLIAFAVGLAFLLAIVIPLRDSDQAMRLAGLGFLSGVLLTGLQRHLTRRIGFIPPTATLLAALLIASPEPAGWGWFFLTFAAGCIVLPAAIACLRLALPASPLLTLAWMLLAPLVLAGLLVAIGPTGLIVVGVLFAVWAWAVFLRDFLEFALEILLWPCYRVRSLGPGLARFPLRGPVLMVANHAAWFDPLWLAKHTPRPITPMMTSVHFDRPVLRWLMVHVVDAIRVLDSRFRREAPELDEAVRRLDRGECVLIFPEAFVRRTEERPLRPFGQGVWRILKARPNTPVVVCWIEGGWKSFTSYWNGLPTKNKPLDWWRPIRIAYTSPQVLDPALLEDQRGTRNHLWRECLEARRLLGLEVPATELGEQTP